MPMPQREASSEKDMYLRTLGRESEITLKLLKAFPADKADFKPHPRSRSAKDLAWTFVVEQGFADGAMKGNVDFSQPMPPAPEDFGDVIAAFERAEHETADKLAATSEDDLNQTMTFPVGPGQMGDLRRFDVLWTMLMDQIHHRGQLSVYLRLAGAKVPSIYGPSADEPWR